MNIIAAFYFTVFTDDADMTFCCANPTNDFLGRISSLVSVLSIFFTQDALVNVFLVFGTEPVAWYLKIVFVFGPGT
jgi:hypothetical protein